MPQQQLFLLLVELPPTPSSLRVRVWRRLRSLGAIALKRSAYLLPDAPERYEDFQCRGRSSPQPLLIAAGAAMGFIIFALR